MKFIQIASSLSMSPKGPMIQLVALADNGKVYVYNKASATESYWEELTSEVRLFDDGKKSQ